ncbi:hypothetical protein C8R43DRAFT_950034 [Mycena crocata]|nr:hypothetical protein C8R43DRAFT_950034 [Mycena crocata]
MRKRAGLVSMAFCASFPPLSLAVPAPRRAPRTAPYATRSPKVCDMQPPVLHIGIPDMSASAARHAFGRGGFHLILINLCTPATLPPPTHGESTMKKAFAPNCCHGFGLKAIGFGLVKVEAGPKIGFRLDQVKCNNLKVSGFLGLRVASVGLILNLIMKTPHLITVWVLEGYNEQETYTVASICSGHLEYHYPSL